VAVTDVKIRYIYEVQQTYNTSEQIRLLSVSFNIRDILRALHTGNVPSFERIMTLGVSHRQQTHFSTIFYLTNLHMVNDKDIGEAK
jgi:hypothetical protein